MGQSGARDRASQKIVRRADRGRSRVSTVERTLGRGTRRIDCCGGAGAILSLSGARNVGAVRAAGRVAALAGQDESSVRRTSLAPDWSPVRAGPAWRTHHRGRLLDDPRPSSEEVSTTPSSIDEPRSPGGHGGSLPSSQPSPLSAKKPLSRRSRGQTLRPRSRASLDRRQASASDRLARVRSAYVTVGLQAHARGQLRGRKPSGHSRMSSARRRLGHGREGVAEIRADAPSRRPRHHRLGTYRGRRRSRRLCLAAVRSGGRRSSRSCGATRTRARTSGCLGQWLDGPEGTSV